MGIRPGEKIYEELVSKEEAARSIEMDGYYVIKSILPELEVSSFIRNREYEAYTSINNTLTIKEIKDLLKKTNLELNNLV